MRHPIPVLNQGHALNKGLISWWLATGHSTGWVWPDLCGRTPQLRVDIGSTGAIPIWGGALGRPGGHGSIVADGLGSSFQATTVRGIPDLSLPFTLAAWALLDSTSGTRCLIEIDQGGYTQAVDLELRASTLRLGAAGGGAYVDSGVTPNLSEWFHLLATWDGTTNRIYYNGLEAANSVTGHTSSSAADRITLGDSPFGEVWSGRVDDFRYWLRALSPTEARQVYDNSRQGYPGLFVRPRQSRYRKPAAAVATAGVVRRVLTSEWMLRKPRVRSGRVVV